MRSVTLRPEAHRRLLAGHPWVYSNEIVMDPAAKAIEPGSLVRLLQADGRAMAQAFFNPRTLIAARVLTRDLDAPIDAGFFAARLERARRLRDRLFGKPYYRLIHAEADGVPGVVVDRFGSLCVVQINTAGMESLQPVFLAALEQVLAPDAILLRSDSTARSQEGLAAEVTWAKGKLDPPVELLENGLRFLCDPVGGQKTGWFYDQRESRAAVARLAEGARVLDLYSYAGGFALAAAGAGARKVLAIDRSEAALALAEQAAALNGLAERCRFRRAEAFEALESLAAGDRFDIVVADPPAFVKSKKDLKQGARAYRKLARLAAAATAPEGFLFIASCSHNMPHERFLVECAAGIARAGRSAALIRDAGAGPDHPIHPQLPETAYLKALVYAVS